MEIKQKISRSDQAERRRKELLEVSLRLFSENGYDATSIREIANEAGVTEGLIYHYFQGKKDLLKAIVEGSVLEDGLARHLEGIESLPLEKALTGIGGYLLEALRKKRVIFRLMLSESRLFEKDNDHFFPKLIYENNMIRFGAFLDRRMEREEIRRMDPVLLARQFAGSLVAFFIFQEILLGKAITDVPTDHFIRNLVEVFIHGIGISE
ncbi:MAG: TetR/AcrR family transcriptional regulator [Nitrospiria bacterium]